MSKEKVNFYCGTKVTSNQVKPCTKEWMKEVMDSPTTLELCQKYQSTGNESYKIQLPYICPQAAFPGDKRLDSEAVRTGLIGLDLDDHDGTLGFNPEQVWKEMIQPRLDDDLRDVLMVYRTASGKGLRTISRCPQGMSILQAQIHIFHLISQGQLPEEVLDRGCYNPSRAFFLCPTQDVFYMDEEQLFTPTESPEEPEEAATIAVAETTEEPTSETPRNPDISEDGTCYKDISYVEIISELCSKVLNIRGMMPEKGNRNNKLFQLCMYLSYITQDEKHLLSVLPNWGLPEQEVRSTASNTWKRHLKEKMPVRLTQVLDHLAGEEEQPLAPPALPRHIPKFFKVLLRIYPEFSRASLACCSIPALGTLGCNVHFHYNGKENHHLDFLVCLASPQASGKSKMVHLSNFIMQDIIKQDEENRAKMREWKDRNLAKGSNKDREKNPHLPIIMPNPTCSNAQFFEMKQNTHRGLYICAPEIDSISSKNWALSTENQRLAFDREYGGQDTKSDNSTSAKVLINLNTCVSGTPQAVFGKHYRDVENGTVSRTLFVSFPDRRGMENIPLGEYTEEETIYLLDEITRLTNLGEDQPNKVYEIDATGVQKEMDKWVKKQLDLYRRTNDEALETFFKRDAIMGARAMVLAMLVEGGKLTKAAINFGLFIADTALYYHLRFFGALERASKQKNYMRMNGDFLSEKLSKNPTFDKMPVEFTAIEYRESMIAAGLKGTGYRQYIKNILASNMIIPIEGTKLYRKVGCA